MEKKIRSMILIAGSALLSLMLIAPRNAIFAASDQPVSEFADATLESWSERSFKGNTVYELVEDNGVRVLRGQTRKQASILYREQTIDLTETPVITWSWKIDSTYRNISEQTRAGDDFPARLYVVSKVGLLPWNTVAINYVWASETPVGKAWNNPFTDKAKMIAIQSGDTDVNQWTRHSRNIVDDFKRLFDRDVTRIDGYAVMVDGDNAQVDATAWFGEIAFSANWPMEQ